ncbi:hypothetical protein D0862_01613 [Hortaea werneckii]|uniref:Ubiquitin-like domain-containing protein n=1 Tax=Hortaea werneckii TaxID=91943 RepID=A0A3M7HR98_HORWE|nr:hypothetical protein D0862_01613 [Hortaea werneckii]
MASEPVEEMPYTEPPPAQQPATPAQPDQLTLKFRDMNDYSIDFKLKPVLPDQTPSDLDLEDGDEIDVHMEQIGGHII